MHVGIVLMFLGFAGEGFKQQKTVAADAGQGGDGRRLHASGSTRCARADDERKQAITAHITVLRDGAGAHQAVSGAVVLPHAPERADDGGRDPPLVRRGPVRRDAGVRSREAVGAPRGRRCTPLVNWVWLGFGMHRARHADRAAAGDGVCVRHGARAGQRRAPRACCCCRSCCWPVALQAQDVRATRADDGVQQSPLQTRLEGEIICMCGLRLRPGDARQLPDAARLSRAHRGADADPAAASPKARPTTRSWRPSSSEHGQHVLAVPEDKGFNRLAWLLPYLLAGAGLVAIVVNARRWSHRPAAARSGPRRRRIPRSTPAWTMSSETSTERSG